MDRHRLRAHSYPKDQSSDHTGHLSVIVGTGDGRIAAFLDPAIYYGHAEVELAYTTLFGTFGQAFFERYGEHRPIAPGFFELRRALYTLYPLLVHTTLFGGTYPASVDAILRRHT